MLYTFDSRSGFRLLTIPSKVILIQSLSDPIETSDRIKGL